MLRIKYYTGTRNFGDELNHYIFEDLLGRRVQAVEEPWNDTPHLMFIGSMIRRATSKTLIWGAGLIDEYRLPAAPPSKIACVRGPLTKKRLLHTGLLLPNRNVILGDPALLLSFLSPIRPKRKPNYDIGLIPHYADRDLLSTSLWRSPIRILKNRLRRSQERSPTESELSFGDIKARIIDVQGGGCAQIIEQICDCAFIASSSLHGLIVADALGIPNTWIKLGDNLDGGAFKFIDHMRSVGRYDVNPLLLCSKQIDKDFVENAIGRQNQWSVTFDFLGYKAAFDDFLSTDDFRSCCDP